MRIRRSTAVATALATFVATVLGLVGGTAWAVQTAQPSIVSDNPANFTPNVLDGKVEAIAQVGSTIFIGGTFTQVQQNATGSPVLSRSNIAAFNATTGVVSTTFAPVLNGEVTAIIPSGDGLSIFVGGYFSTINGNNARRVLKLNVSNGTRITGFTAAVPNNNVQDMRLVHGQLIIAGPFTMVGTQTRGQMASLNPTTGALTSFLQHTFAGPHNGGALTVNKIDATPDGNKILGLGNFTTVDGQPRDLLFLLDTSGATSVLSNWQTNFFVPGCASVFDTYMRDLDISPDGTYAVVSTTGAYGGSASPCDTTTRWDMTTTAQDLKPVWQDTTGGDTTYAVGITGSAVYVGGHMRWENNPLAGDSQGPGGVPREGIAALDPATGLPLSWNPGRDRGVGVFDFLATSTGLWVGSDTDLIAGEARGKIAFFPLAGGITPPANLTGTLSNDVYLLGSPTAGTDQSVLYRVDAGGPAIQSADDGPDWADDTSDPSPYRNSGSNTASYSPSASPDATIPNSATDRAPLSLFDSERWDPGSAGDGGEMQWHFPVTAGTHVTVRLYLANRYSGTASAGQRVFSIQLDGSTVAPNVDLSGSVGNNVATMKSYNVTSDGSIDLTWLHQVENPLVNGIEIINDDVTPGPGAGVDSARRDFFTGSTAPSNPGTVTTSELWGQSRGSFLVDGTVYSGWADGTFQARSFDGTAFGSSTSIPLYGNTFIGDLPNITGLAYLNNRIYYTLFNDNNLYWRSFTPQSQVVGSLRFTVDNGAAMSPGRVAGMFASGTSLYFADRTSGTLNQAQLTGTGGATSNPGSVAGAATLVDSSIDWRSRGAFVWNGTPALAANIPPTAVASGVCAANVCSFDGSTSNDPDGTIASYAWDFGDSAHGTGASPNHSYSVAGPFTATLTVTDNRGGTGSTTVVVNPTAPPNQPPVASFTSTCSLLSCTFDATNSADPDGSIASYLWDFGDHTSDTGSAPMHAFAASGTYSVTLTVTDNSGAPGVATTPVTVSSVPPANIAFRAAAAAQANAAVQKVTVPAAVHSGDVMLLFATANSTAAVSTQPTGWTFVSQRTSGTPDVSTRLYEKVATGTDPGSQVSITYAAAGKIDLTVSAYSGVDATTPISAFASAGETVSRAAHTTPGANVATGGSWVVSYWADKSSATTGWTAPAGQTQRSQSVGTGSGLVTSLQVDSGAGLSPGLRSGLAATASSASAKATMWTVVLAPNGAPPPPNQPPVASFTSSCTNLACSFNGTGSSDPDGSVVSYAWDFGDGGSSTSSTPTHTFPAGGTFAVALTVTDNQGAVNAKSVNLTVSGVAATQIAFRASAAAQANAAVQKVTVPAAVHSGDVMLLLASSNSVSAVTTDPAGWTFISQRTSGAPDLSTRLYEKVATGSDPGSQVSLTYAAAGKVDLTIAAYSGVDPTTPIASFASAGETVSRAAHATPGGTVASTNSWVVSYWADKSSATTGWTAPAGQTQRSLSVGSGSGLVTSLLADSGAAVSTGPSNALTATASAASAKATMWTIILKVGP
jgi:PKD repeat protein